MPGSRLQFRGKEVNGMFKRIHRDEGGFTLVELLVTISILAVLFGIVALSLAGVGANAEKEVKAAELGVVQSAVDIYMAVNNVITVTASTSCATIAGGGTDFSKYLRRDTKYSYAWDTDGKVSKCP